MKKYWFLLLLLPLFAGCSSSRKVTRIDESKQIDLSGRWNDTDSRLVAEEMIKDALSRIWLSNFTENKNRNPVLIVGLIKNKTSEHISTETFIKDIEREFINSGKIKVVQSSTARDE